MVFIPWFNNNPGGSDSHPGHHNRGWSTSRPDYNPGGSNTGTIIGGVVGGIVFIAIIGVALYFGVCKRGFSRVSTNEN